MPNVVVYVKAGDAEQFDDQRALAEFVRAAAAAALAARGKRPRKPVSDGTFRPDPKPSRK